MVSKANLLHKLFALTTDMASEGKEAKKGKRIKQHVSKQEK